MKYLYDEIKERIALIEGTYDIIRIVDHINKSSIIVKANEIKNIKGTCYDFWKKGSACNNCISMRAYNKNETFIKIEYVSSKIFLITAIPLCIDGKIYVLETLKDISENGRKFNDNNDGLSIQTVINEINDKPIIDKASGVYNRKYINERLLIDINNCNIYGYPLSVIMITIDYLKGMGYKYGEDIEDKIIREFVKIAKKLIVNSSDWIGRYNRDSFFIVLNNGNNESRMDILKRVNNLFSDFIFKYKEISTKITISLKIYCTENKDTDIENILAKMYEQFYGENAENKELENNESLSNLNYKIKELQEVLNEVCVTSEDNINYEKRLEISQYLDELIVRYMKNIKGQNKNNI